MTQARKTSRKRNRTLFVRLTLLVFFLVVVGIYLAVSQKRISKIESIDDTVTYGKAPQSYDVSGWKTYADKAYGYSISYPPLLVPKEGEGNTYLRFVVFLATEGTGESGFAISVRDTTLDKEAELIKEEIQKDVSARLVKEEKMIKDGYPGAVLEFEPEEFEEVEPRTIVIINNGRYSYTISAKPERINAIVSTLKFLNKD